MSKSFFQSKTKNVVSGESKTTVTTTKKITTNFQTSTIVSSSSNGKVEIDAKSTTFNGFPINGENGSLFYSFNNSATPGPSLLASSGRASFSGVASAKPYTPVYPRTPLSSGYQQPVSSLSSTNLSTSSDRKLSAPAKTSFFKTKNTSLPPQPTQQIHASASLPSVLKNSDDYNLKEPAYVLIFNQDKFSSDSEVDDRVGSAEDVKRLEKMFKNYRAEIKIHKNSKLKKIYEIMKNLKDKNFTSYSCVILVYMSHGHRKDILLANDTHFDLNDVLVEPLAANKTLNNKAKLFFIQACKGDYRMETDATPFKEAKAKKWDLFIAYSTYEGHVSMRDKEKGTFFIQELCNVIESEGNVPLSEIMKALRKRFIEKNFPQSPTDTTTLIKNFRFAQLKKK